MKFLLDESSDARLLVYLREHGHDAKSLAQDYAPGLPDNEVLTIAAAEGRVLITNDRDFGQLVFQQRARHSGVILFRLGDYAPIAAKVAALERVLVEHGAALTGFLVVEPHRVRVRRTASE